MILCDKVIIRKYVYHGQAGFMVCGYNIYAGSNALAAVFVNKKVVAYRVKQRFLKGEEVTLDDMRAT